MAARKHARQHNLCAALPTRLYGSCCTRWSPGCVHQLGILHPQCACNAMQTRCYLLGTIEGPIFPPEWPREGSQLLGH
jgi:hypothetical protein